MCEVILVKVQCVTVKLLTIFHNKKYLKAIFKRNNCCSITSRRAVTRVLQFGDTTMCYCEGIEYFISDVFRVSHFADGPLGLVSQTPAHLDQCILHGAEESLF